MVAVAVGLLEHQEVREAALGKKHLVAPELRGKAIKAAMAGMAVEAEGLARLVLTLDLVVHMAPMVALDQILTQLGLLQHQPEQADITPEAVAAVATPFKEQVGWVVVALARQVAQQTIMLPEPQIRAVAEAAEQAKKHQPAG